MYKVETNNKLLLWHYKVMHINVAISIILIAYFLIFDPHDLLGLISTGERNLLKQSTHQVQTQLEELIYNVWFLGFILLLALSTVILTLLLHLNKKSVKQLLSWMAELECRTTYFRNQPYRDIIKKASDYSMKAMKFVTIVIFLVGVSITVLLTANQYFIQGEDYYLPLRSYFPFLPPTNAISYWINLFQQIYTVIIACCYSFPFYCFKFSCLIYLITHLYAIEQLIGHMNEGINAQGFNAWLKQTSREIYDAKM